MLGQQKRQSEHEDQQRQREYSWAMVGGGIEARFEFGLDMLVDGLDKHMSQT